MSTPHFQGTISQRINSAPSVNFKERQLVSEFLKGWGTFLKISKVHPVNGNSISVCPCIKIRWFPSTDFTNATGKAIPLPSAYFPDGYKDEPLVFQTFKMRKASSGDIHFLLALRFLGYDLAIQLAHYLRWDCQRPLEEISEVMYYSRMDTRTKPGPKRNGNLSLYPMKFEDALRAIARVKPERTKAKQAKSGKP